jgi:hypothetical protein
MYEHNAFSPGFMTRITECVPNFSEGRRKEVVDAIAEVAGAFVAEEMQHQLRSQVHRELLLNYLIP